MPDFVEKKVYIFKRLENIMIAVYFCQGELPEKHGKIDRNSSESGIGSDE